MKKKQKFPSDQDLAEARELLSTGPAPRPLPEDADAVQRLKHAICAEFVKYKNKTKVTQKQLAMQLSIDEALMSKMMNYAYEEFTVDRLMKFLSILYPMVDVRLLVA
jgi:predicted XRE-type DNA-binding protein